MKIAITWSYRPWRKCPFVAQARMGDISFIEASSAVSFQDARHELAHELTNLIHGEKSEMKLPEPEEIEINIHECRAA